MAIEEDHHSNSISISHSRSRSRSESRSHQDPFRSPLGFSSITKTFKSFFLKCYPKYNNSKYPSSSPSSSLQHQSKVKKNKDNDPVTDQAQPHHHKSCDGGGNVRRRCHSIDDVQAMTRSFTTLNRPTSTSTHNSNSYHIAKPPAIEHYLYCTLDELCFGCVKTMNVVRTAMLENGEITEKEEELTIKVIPGWRKGTVITFEGRLEKPGRITADVRFVVIEIQHPLFIKREDDLELEVDIPLIDALTGCSLSIPLLGSEIMSLTIDEVIHPGYEAIIEGEGMPRKNGTRGNLVIKFLVQFPEELTEKQRSEAADILQQACEN